MLLLLLWVGVAVGVSFLCSLLEAVLLSVRRSSLLEARERGSTGAALLLRAKTEQLNDSIAAILTLNTVAHTVGASLAGAQAATVAHAWGWAAYETLAVGVFSAILTLLVLALSEILPKTIGAVYAAPLAAPVGHLLQWLIRATWPCLLLTRGLTRLVTRGKQARLSRAEVRAFLAVARSEGALASDEERWHARLLQLDRIPVADVLTPRVVVQMLPEDATVDALLGMREAEPFARIPLYRESPDQVTGYVFQPDVLRAAVRGAARETPLRRFARPVHFVPETASARSALRDLLSRNLHFAIVVDEHGGVAGLVSLEDLTETLFGTELTDEADRATDMRQLALRLGERRLGTDLVEGSARDRPPS